MRSYIDFVSAGKDLGLSGLELKEWADKEFSNEKEEEERLKRMKIEEEERLERKKIEEEERLKRMKIEEEERLERKKIEKRSG